MTSTPPHHGGIDLSLLASVLPDVIVDHPDQVAFLERRGPADLQAAPGSGKTTLLVAKLCLLADSWQHPKQGICMLSHTNVAREEVQKRLSRHPRGRALLGYPHFIGTITAFTHQFLANPYMRGRGLQIRTVDDGVFSAEVVRALWRDWTIKAWLGRKRDPDEAAEAVALALRVDPITLRLQDSDTIPKSGKVRSKLETIRADMTAKGMFLFADMADFAQESLSACSDLKAAVAQRFPLAFVDEAQDTTETHVRLLNAALGGSAVQWIGDCNQSIYHGGRPVWTPTADADRLGKSRRFGPKTAAFASELTIAQPQSIEGGGGDDALHAVILFDRHSILNVLPTYARLVTAASAGNQHPDTWAVAARHKVPTRKPKSWPNCIGDYWSSYVHPQPKGEGAGTLLGAMQEARRQAHALGSASGAHSVFSSSVLRYLSRSGWRPPTPSSSPRGAWQSIDDASPGARLLVRKLLLQSLTGPLPADEHEWQAGPASVVSLLVEELTGRSPKAEDSYLAFTAVAPPGTKPRDANVFHLLDGDCDLRIHLGTIASIKGRTHDYSLVLETNEGQKMDVAEALKRAFGGAKGKVGTQLSRALVNVFVGATRPRHGLVMATRTDALPETLTGEIKKAGWQVVYA